MNLIGSSKELFRRLLQRSGYEIYRRPYLPKGADAFLSLRAHWPDWQPALIFDVGANVGQTVARLRPLFPAANIICFEPVPLALAALRQSTASDPLVQIQPLALGRGPGEATIHLHASLEQSSMSPELLEQLDPSAPRLRVPVDSLTGFCSHRDIRRIDLLKIDVEGQELAVLQGAEALLAAGAVDFIVVEAGLGSVNPRFTPLHEICERLRPHGYWLVGVYEQFGRRFHESAEFCNAAFALEKHFTPGLPD